MSIINNNKIQKFINGMFDETWINKHKVEIKQELENLIKINLFEDFDNFSELENKEVLAHIKNLLKINEKADRLIAELKKDIQKSLLKEYTSCYISGINLIDYLSNDWLVKSSPNPNMALIDSISENTIWKKSQVAKVIGTTRETVSNWCRNSDNNFKSSTQGVEMKSFLPWLLENRPKNFNVFKTNYKG